MEEPQTKKGKVSNDQKGSIFHTVQFVHLSSSKSIEPSMSVLPSELKKGMFLLRFLEFGRNRLVFLQHVPISFNQDKKEF